jgi:hypothetical protein
MIFLYLFVPLVCNTMQVSGGCHRPFCSCGFTIFLGNHLCFRIFLNKYFLVLSSILILHNSVLPLEHRSAVIKLFSGCFILYYF